MLPKVMIGTLLLSISTVGMHLSDRQVGKLVSDIDEKTFKKIKNSKDIVEGEIVAVYHYSQWVYGTVVMPPGSLVDTGMINITPENPVWKNMAINFKKNVRKLKTYQELQEQNAHDERWCAVQ